MPGGVKTNGDKNPAFRIYEIDQNTKYPLRANKYVFNLIKANMDDSVDFEFAYEYTEEYGMNDFSPRSFKTLSESIRDNSNIATKFIRSKF
jgi:hypothetical protein